MSHVTAAFVLVSLLGLSVVLAEDPYLFFTWNVTYGSIAPLGIRQKVILINNQFPGPEVNCTSNNNIIINVFNNLDEPFLLTWNGVQNRKNSWMDGTPGTNCPIPPGQNFTYHFQPKDQIGTFFYFPSVGMQKAAGGFGMLRVHSRLLIPVPFAPPAEEFDVLAGDWFTASHKLLARKLDAGRGLGLPAGVLINGRPGRPVTGHDDPPMFTVQAGNVYRFRFCNVGLKTSLNFRIQKHSLKLVEMEGSHTIQNLYDSLDVHVGQCLSVLVVADQGPGDYYLVVSTRFTKKIHTATAVLRYAGSNTPPSPVIPEGPSGWAWSFNQWRTFRWNLTASAARPNPQGSYHYGEINITRTIKLLNGHTVVDGKRRHFINGVSHVDPDTPLKLAEYFNLSNPVFNYNLMGDVPPALDIPVKLAPNVITAEFRTFIEIIFENTERSIQSYHLDGYAFFPVGMGPGKWSPESRRLYNLLDTVSRHSIHVFPKSWTAIMLTFDNAGMWNLRSMNWENKYLGQQLYVSVTSPARSLRDEYNMPDNTLRCGAVVGLPLPPSYV
ncbi:L-ascorbate oxidase homolog [Elaeis guineensis]|uniref:L-ascorbate oxidase homolog n=1 Tax=Elaeis guineensis var. tenera TaxID=51953 RepID=A0A6I9S0T6_ELAGV|nr:L-ascorbate oxidase homolog [Elaeis guineensis]